MSFYLLLPLFVYAAVYVLSVTLPAREYQGYVTNDDSGVPPRYRLNGLRVGVLVVGVFVAGSLAGLWAPDVLYRERWSLFAGAFVVGLIASWVVFVREPSLGGRSVSEFYLGRRRNLMLWRGVDAKMYLYAAGAVMLALNVVSIASAHHTIFGAAANPGIYLASLMLLFFVFDYLIFERVHLYTYDIFAESVGFKLVWGCLAFYPMFYPIGLWALADRPEPALLQAAPVGWTVLSVVVFLGGWLLARGANLQKYAFKRSPDRAFLGRFAPRVLSDQNGLLLASLFWARARHINYLGEILMAVGIALATGHIDSPWPWLYPLYYVLLLLPRERDDERRCAQKYGPLWDEYKKRVPYRIIPGVY